MKKYKQLFHSHKNNSDRGLYDLTTVANTKHLAIVADNNLT